MENGEVLIVLVYLVNGFRDQTEEVPEGIRVLEVSAGVAFLHNWNDTI